MGVFYQDGFLFGDGRIHDAIERGLNDIVTPEVVGHMIKRKAHTNSSQLLLAVSC